MVKSGQREYPVVKSKLNILRETILFICSLILWAYCMIVFVIFGAALLGIETHLMQLIRTILNVERSELQNLFKMLFSGLCIITAYMLFAYTYHSVKRRGKSVENH
ncbi:intracellular adhesion protein IcaD [Macrococcus lamae]|uniref:Poly-beta-1,6-N-acetyl-D-glucosamine synthesis protein IcaD n=1 Tax=Macrococcus lamae TaxID=198484 RepID=A0A4V3BF06_9STAP|nr:intracellular adhesion protein IcaD [Macrococcus lamae]TDM12130.1 intracellular adhesion protein D [Macrococcus lamae]